MKKVTIYTDGACSPNPGYGGWAAILTYVYPESGEVEEREISGGEKDTTNNRMELLAVIKALQLMKYACEIDIFVDSEYVKKGITEWIQGWKARGWKTSGGKPVMNQDLWIELDNLTFGHKINWKWVRGHTENTYNNRVDEMAVNARLQIKASDS